MKKTIYYIGIDPGVNTGVAIWHKPSKKFIIIQTVKIHKAMEIVKGYADQVRDQMWVRVEDARMRKEGMFSRDPSILQGVGSVKRDCSIWEDFLSDNNIPFGLVHPKNVSTKLNTNTFNNITKYNNRTSQHGRDAAMLVFGI